MSKESSNTDLPKQVEPIFEYRIVEQESTALSTVFDSLFEMVEKDLSS